MKFVKESEQSCKKKITFCEPMSKQLGKLLLNMLCKILWKSIIYPTGNNGETLKIFET